MDDAAAPRDRQPLPVRALNLLGLPAVRLGIPRLDPAAIMAAAVKTTGIADSGSDLFRPALERLAESLERDGALTLTGRLRARALLLHLVCVRLQAADHLRRRPAGREKIHRPLVITGLPRSGGNLLHCLIAQDEASRAMTCWETCYPFPPPEHRSIDADPRVGRAAKDLASLRRLAPALGTLGPQGPGMPQDCAAVLAYECRSHLFTVAYNVPSYQSFIDAEPAGSLYALHKSWLQYLQSGGIRAERWVLRSPAHLSGLAGLFKIYPEAVVVQTHREPVGALASFTSATAILRRAASDHVDPAAIAHHHLEWWEDLLVQGMDYRAAHQDRAGQFIDVRYDELVKDPVACVERIYRHFGFDFTFDFHKRMQHFLNTNKPGRYGVHRYAPEDFGMDRKREQERFKRYRQTYRV